MTRVSGTDQVLLLLKERLQRMDRGRTRGAARAAAKPRPTRSPVERLQTLASLDQVPADELRRTLIRALLSEELGEGIANDPSFQAVSDEVFRLINDSEEGRNLIERAADELRHRN